MNIQARITDSTEVNMTSKGQVLIPKVIRDQLGLVPGHAVTVGINDRGEAVVVSTIRARRANETPEQRQARILHAIDNLAGRYSTGQSTAEVMEELRGDRTP